MGSELLWSGNGGKGERFRRLVKVRLVGGRESLEGGRHWRCM